MIFESPEKKALINRKIMPYTANSEEKKSGCLAFDPTKAFWVSAADKPESNDAPRTIIRPRR
jgi:hypothetical protein